VPCLLPHYGITYLCSTRNSEKVLLNKIKRRNQDIDWIATNKDEIELVSIISARHSAKA
jgi:hypothetical protein